LSLRESGTLLIFKVIGQGHQIKILGEGICHTLHCPVCKKFGQNPLKDVDSSVHKVKIRSCDLDLENQQGSRLS
jgi:hypothetical protein